MKGNMIRAASTACFVALLLLLVTFFWRLYVYRKDHYLFVDLAAFKGDSGLGNLVFELIGSISIARKFQRTLVINRKDYDKMKNKYPEFTNLIAETRWNVSNQLAMQVYDFYSFDCCRFNTAIDDIVTSRSGVLMRMQYLQSFKYFESFSLEEIRTLLRVGEPLQKIARDELIKKTYLDEFDHKLCVHSRRGDFLTSYEQAPSTAEFTLPAVDYILDQLHAQGVSTPLVIMIGDDPNWQRNVTKQINHAEVVILPRSNSSNSPAIDWQFSEMYCDTVLLTASSSTFGWWLAYLSKGQQVYYNYVFAKGDGFGTRLDPNDFFPHNWTALELSTAQNVDTTFSITAR